MSFLQPNWGARGRQRGLTTMFSMACSLSMAVSVDAGCAVEEAAWAAMTGGRGTAAAAAMAMAMAVGMRWRRGRGQMRVTERPRRGLANYRLVKRAKTR